jgi:hypothetical protein
MDLPTVFLSKAAALLLVQGMPLSRLFPRDLRFNVVGTTLEKTEDQGAPLILLRAKPPILTNGLPRVEGIVLGRVVSSEGLSEQEVLGLLVEAALA